MSLALSAVRRRLKDVVELAKKELWHWERFPIVLPDPIIQSKSKSHCFCLQLSRNERVLFFLYSGHTGR